MLLMRESVVAWLSLQEESTLETRNCHSIDLQYTRQHFRYSRSSLHRLALIVTSTCSYGLHIFRHFGFFDVQRVLDSGSPVASADGPDERGLAPDGEMGFRALVSELSSRFNFLKDQYTETFSPNSRSSVKWTVSIKLYWSVNYGFILTDKFDCNLLIISKFL